MMAPGTNWGPGWGCWWRRRSPKSGGTYLVDGKSIKAICRELGVSRKVVRKVLRSGATEFHYERCEQPMPRLGPWVFLRCTVD